MYFFIIKIIYYPKYLGWTKPPHFIKVAEILGKSLNLLFVINNQFGGEIDLLYFFDLIDH